MATGAMVATGAIACAAGAVVADIHTTRYGRHPRRNVRVSAPRHGSTSSGAGRRATKKGRTPRRRAFVEHVSCSGHEREIVTQRPPAGLHSVFRRREDALVAAAVLAFVCLGALHGVGSHFAGVHALGTANGVTRHTGVQP